MEKGNRKTACTIKELLSQFAIFENGPDYVLHNRRQRCNGENSWGGWRQGDNPEGTLRLSIRSYNFVGNQLLRMRAAAAAKLDTARARAISRTRASLSEVDFDGKGKRVWQRLINESRWWKKEREKWRVLSGVAQFSNIWEWAWLQYPHYCWCDGEDRWHLLKAWM